MNLFDYTTRDSLPAQLNHDNICINKSSNIFLHLLLIDIQCIFDKRILFLRTVSARTTKIFSYLSDKKDKLAC